MISFGGGGMKGFAYAGALDELRKRHAIDWGARCPPLKVVYGCSIGAIVGLALSVGYTTTELIDLVNAIKLDDIFMFDPVRFFSSIGDTSVSALGMDDGNKLRSYLFELVCKKMSPCTLRELFEKTGTDLRVHATNISSATPITFTHSTHPCMSVIDAVYASAALPPFFPPLEYDGALYADGGITQHTEEKCITFGLKSAPLAISDDLNQWPWPLASYLDRVLRMILPAHDEPHVCIQSGTSAVIKFGDMTDMKRALLQAGRDAISEHGRMHSLCLDQEGHGDARSLTAPRQ